MSQYSCYFLGDFISSSKNEEKSPPKQGVSRIVMNLKIIFLLIFNRECYGAIPTVEEASSMVKFGPGSLTQCQNFKESHETYVDGTRVNVIESSHPYENDENCVQVVGDENCSKIKFQITHFAVEDEDPEDDYRHGDGISHCEFDAFQISWKDDGFYK